jgi:capsular polysaccharide transport system ATP-binding protein
MLIIENLGKAFDTHKGRHWVFRNINLQIPPGSRVAVLGANGSGKTTLMRLLGGGDHPTEGRVIRRCRVSWSMRLAGGFQPQLTGRQNTRFLCRIFEMEDRMDEVFGIILEFTGLGVMFDEPIRTYSSGMRSRLAFSLSLAFQFDIYLLDEITVVGDRAFRQQALEAFEALLKTAGLLLVSHNEDQLRSLCSQALWIKDGQIIWFDDLEDGIRAYNADADKPLRTSRGWRKRLRTTA